MEVFIKQILVLRSQLGPIMNHQMAGMTAFLAGGYSLNLLLYHRWLMVAAISWLTTTQTQTGTQLLVKAEAAGVVSCIKSQKTVKLWIQRFLPCCIHHVRG